MNTISFDHLITKAEERSYFTLPFFVPENCESMSVAYVYPRHVQHTEGGVTYDTEQAIIDLGVNAPHRQFVGASGSDRTSVTLSPYGSTHGYAAVDIVTGQWEIIVGAYKVPEEGVIVHYEISFAPKTMRMFKGDLHTHTTGSDGVLTPEELADLCVKQHLDFVFVTNHNTWFENDYLPRNSSITMLPGTEWTHYRGHANLLGIRRPYQNPFCVNSDEQAAAILHEAKENGAFVSFNHPFCKPECGWNFGMELFPMDAVEIWNGALMAGSNEDALTWWHMQLCEGRHLVAVAGSDFHRTGPLSLPGLPTTCLYALSRSPSDLMEALRHGRLYLSQSPDSPEISCVAGENQVMGDTLAADTAVTLCFHRIRSGDTIRIITDLTCEEIVCPDSCCHFEKTVRPRNACFLRCEVLRALLHGQDAVRVAIGNPVYFRQEEPLCTLRK